MPKWLLFGLAALLDFVLAVMSYRDGRSFIAAILAFAGVLFIIAAVGSTRGVRGGGKP